MNSFGGAVITVSHDRLLLDKVADKLLILNDEGKPGVFFGDMSEYLLVRDKKREREAAKQEIKKAAAPVPPWMRSKKRPNGPTWSRRKWETIEDDIAELGGKRSDIAERDG